MREFSEIFDISPMINSHWAVFPGDQAFEPKVLLSFEKGHHLHLSSFTTTVHIGAHADAPLHYSAQADSIDKLHLNPYLGPVQVVEVETRSRHRISENDFNLSSVCSRRVLFKTKSFETFTQWSENFMAFEPQLIRALSARGVCLLGIDTPSVDLADSKDLPAHRALLEADMRVLEGLSLTHVSAGEYYLSALPLKIEGAEAAPVRAVLFK